jgi:hypothetical protein
MAFCHVVHGKHLNLSSSSVKFGYSKPRKHGSQFKVTCLGVASCNAMYVPCNGTAWFKFQLASSFLSYCMLPCVCVHSLLLGGGYFKYNLLHGLRQKLRDVSFLNTLLFSYIRPYVTNKSVINGRLTHSNLVLG